MAINQSVGLKAQLLNINDMLEMTGMKEKSDEKAALAPWQKQKETEAADTDTSEDETDEEDRARPNPASFPGG